MIQWPSFLYDIGLFQVWHRWYCVALAPNAPRPRWGRYRRYCRTCRGTSPKNGTRWYNNTPDKWHQLPSRRENIARRSSRRYSAPRAIVNPLIAVDENEICFYFKESAVINYPNHKYVLFCLPRCYHSFIVLHFLQWYFFKVCLQFPCKSLTKLD